MTVSSLSLLTTQASIAIFRRIMVPLSKKKRTNNWSIADHGEVVPEAGTTHKEATIHAPLSAARLPCLPRTHLQFLI
jgi:hypothetical protein